MESVNLLPWRRTQTVAWRRRWWGGLVILLLFFALLLSLPAGYFHYETARWQGIRSQLAQEQQRLQQQINDRLARQGEQQKQRIWLEQAQQLQQQNRQKVQRLLQLPHWLPGDLWLQVMREQNEWQLQGLSYSHAAIVALMEQLYAQPQLLSAQLDFVSTARRASLLRFQITAHWQGSHGTP
ncbi:MAG: PilN domain-containing protein [Enterobacteriaceae bacterium]